jgi:hypothetical protein
MPAPYPLQLEFQAERRITRWRPLVQWLLAIPHLMIVGLLRSFRQVLILISFFTVLFAKQIPRPLPHRSVPAVQPGRVSGNRFPLDYDMPHPGASRRSRPARKCQDGASLYIHLARRATCRYR